MPFRLSEVQVSVSVGRFRLASVDVTAGTAAGGRFRLSEIQVGAPAGYQRWDGTQFVDVPQSATITLAGVGDLAVDTVTTRQGAITIDGAGILTVTAGTGPVGPSILAVPEATNSPPRIRLLVTGFSGLTVTVLRYDHNGSTVVRTASPGELSGGVWSGYDDEMPYNELVSYAAIPAGTTTAAAITTATLPVTRPWLVHPGVPSLSQPVDVLLGVGPDLYASPAGLHAVLGRAADVVISDGTRKAAKASMTAYTQTYDAADALTALLADCTPLLFQYVLPGVERQLYRWVAIGDVSVDGAGQPFGDPWAEWPMSYSVVDRPVGALQAQRTYADVLAESTTYQVVFDTFSTYLDLLNGFGT